MLTKEQKEERINGLGASDSSIHMGYSNFMTPYELWMQKTGMIPLDDSEDELQYWGNKLERVIAERFEEDNNCSLTFPDTLYHKDYDFIFANLDGYDANNNAVVEIKNVNSFMRHEWDNALKDGIPLKYLIQLAKQCHIVGASKGYCAILIGGFEYHQFEYERDLKLEEKIIEKDKEFWEMVVNKTPPECMTISDCRLKYKDVDDSLKSYANYRIEQEYIELINVKNNIKSLTEREKSIKKGLMDYMKHSQYLYDHNNELLATWKANKKNVRTFKVKD